MAKSNAARKRARQRKKAARASLKGRGDYEVMVGDPPGSNMAEINAARELRKQLGKELVSIRQMRMRNAYRDVGGELGSALGAPRLGRLAGAGMSRLMGHGDYAVKVNSLMGRYPKDAGPAGPTPAFFENRGRWGFRVREREYIGDI
jgi:hypothetical protein